MKRVSFYKILLVVLTLAGVYSCKDMMDFHQEYIKNGETVYLAKVDSLVTYPGKNRIQISGYLSNAYNVSKIKVYWNDRADSLIFNYTKAEDMDSLNLIIPNLAEKSYIFDIYTINDLGNRSIKVPIAGTAYGDFFQSTLADRMIDNNMAFSLNGELSINWLSSIDNSIGCELNYVNTEGKAVKKIVPNDEATTVLTDVASGLKYRTLFLPEPTCIDTFYTSFNPIKVIVEEKLSNEGWTITGFDTEEPAEGAPNGLASAAIDGDLGTFWHTQWDGGNPGYPHWFSVDLGKEVTLSSFEVFRRQGDGRGQTRNQFLYSLNGTDWSEFGTFSMDPNTDAGQKCSSTAFPKARYIKYVAVEGPNFFAFLSELNVYIAR